MRVCLRCSAGDVSYLPIVAVSTLSEDLHGGFLFVYSGVLLQLPPMCAYWCGTGNSVITARVSELYICLLMLCASVWARSPAD